MDIPTKKQTSRSVLQVAAAFQAAAATGIDPVLDFLTI
jgi:hypothetical protein